ncbi:MAG: tetratricopeptide repeat protein [Deltaproteobacteria bacterium]|nr:tetratricopeptide repeat protein [Deltaproteobacteria bacterium]
MNGPFKKYVFIAAAILASVVFTDRLQAADTDASPDRMAAGYALYDKGAYKQAAAEFTKVIEANPLSYTAFYNRGLCRRELDDFKAAVSDFSKAIMLRPTEAGAFRNRGRAYAELKFYDKAIEDFTEAISLENNDALAYIYRGDAYYSAGIYGYAARDYSAAIAVRPDDDSLYLRRAEAYRRDKQFEEAVADYTKGLELSPVNAADTADVYLVRGGAYLSLGRSGLAGADFKKACELGNKDGCARAKRFK